MPESPVQLHYQSYGQGPPIVILHGLFGMLDNWHTVSRMLAEHFQVFAVDQRNHGRSPHSPELNYDLMAEDVRDFIAQRGLQSSFLLGHSMGGKVAMKTALMFPQLIDRLVVIDIAPRSYPSSHDNILEALTATDLRNVNSRQQVDQELSLRIPDPSVRQFLMKNLARKDDGSLRWKMNLQAIVTHYAEIMEGVDGNGVFSKPALFVRGTKSSYISDGDIPHIVRLFPQASVADFQSGHWVHAEAPEQLVQTVTGFLLKQ